MCLRVSQSPPASRRKRSVRLDLLGTPVAEFVDNEGHALHDQELNAQPSATKRRSDDSEISPSTTTEKCSTYLASTLTHFLCTLSERVDRNSVAFLVCQSVGYRYQIQTRTGEVELHHAKLSEGAEGRSYWEKHTRHSDEACYLGAQLGMRTACNGVSFTEGDCAWMFKEVRHLSRVPTLTRRRLTECTSLSQVHMGTLDETIASLKNTQSAACTPNEKAHLYILQRLNELRQRDMKAGVEQIRQRDTYTLASFKQNDTFEFFIQINRKDFPDDSRPRFSVPCSELSMITLYGKEHIGHVGQLLINFYRTRLYAGNPDEFWKTKLDKTALSFLLIDKTHCIHAAQTVHLAFTLFGDPVCYVSLVAKY